MSVLTVPSWTDNAFTIVRSSLASNHGNITLLSGSLGGATKTIYLPTPCRSSRITVKRSPGEAFPVRVRMPLADITTEIDGWANTPWSIEDVVENVEPYIALFGDGSAWFIAGASGVVLLT